MRDARQIVSKSEIRIDRVQLVWLTLGVVVALALMFGLGTVVGRRSALLEQRPSLDPVAQADADGQMHQELTFYDTLTAPKAPAERQVEPPPPPAPAAAEPPPPAPEKPVAKVDPTPTPATPSPAPKATASTVRRALDAGPPSHGEYTVQVAAYQTRAEADAYAAALSRKGFRAFIVEASISGKGTWYRVRLGRFSDEDEANSAKQILAAADIPAWILKAD